MVLGEIAKAHPQVRIGSYPNTSLKDFAEKECAYKVKLEFASRDPQALQQAVAAVQEQLDTFRLS